MAWYRIGTVNLAANSANIVGVGTDFVNNVNPGDGFMSTDGRVYEVATVVSATQLTLTTPYQGGASNGQSYTIVPTQSFARDLALNAATLLNTFAAVRDGIGQGLIPDGTVAAPGVRFSADQDTGLRRPGANVLALVTGGVDRLIANADGTVNAPGGMVFGIAGNVGSLQMIQSTSDPNDIRARLAYITDGSGYGFAISRRTAGGVNTDLVCVRDSGNVGIGTNTPGSKLHTVGSARFVSAGNNAGVFLDTAANEGWVTGASAGGDALAALNLRASAVRFSPGATEAGRFDSNGNFLVGVATSVNYGGTHRIHVPATTQANFILCLSSGTSKGIYFLTVDQEGWNNANAGMWIGKTSSTGRSINAGGTINANGADYAEYMRKSNGCGAIAKGDVCGVDRNGELVTSWADMTRPVVKSTNPSLVGGDAWDQDAGQMPQAPAYVAPDRDGAVALPDDPKEPPKPEYPKFSLPVRPERDEQETDDDYAARLADYAVARAMVAAAIERADAEQQAYGEELATFATARAAYTTAKAAHDAYEEEYRRRVDDAKSKHAAETQQYKDALDAWRGAHERLRVQVDRVAFCGQVPVNVGPATLQECIDALEDGVAIYLVAVQKGTGISAKAVREADMTLPLYMKRLGVVYRVEGEQVIIDVQHG